MIKTAIFLLCTIVLVSCVSTNHGSTKKEARSPNAVVIEDSNEQCVSEVLDKSKSTKFISEEACLQESRSSFGVECLLWGIETTGGQPHHIAELCQYVNSIKAFECIKKNINLDGSLDGAAKFCGVAR